MIYMDSYLFVFAAAVLQFGLGVDFSLAVCQAAIYICLVCYVTTKLLIYLFLVEKAYIIRSKGNKGRFKTKLWIFNAFGILGVYGAIVIMNFVYRTADIRSDGQCIIGMAWYAMGPLIIFDLLINVYLTILFLIPLSNLYSFNHLRTTRPSHRLRNVAKRTLVGCVGTLTSSIVNLSVLMALKGEPGWICLMCCNGDILFSAVVVHWVTSKDNGGGTIHDSQQACLPSSPGSHAIGHPGSRESTAVRQAGSGPGPDWSPHHKSRASPLGETSTSASVEEVSDAHEHEVEKGPGPRVWPSSTRPPDAEATITRPLSALAPSVTARTNQPDSGAVDGGPRRERSHGRSAASGSGQRRPSGAGGPRHGSY